MRSATITSALADDEFELPVNLKTDAVVTAIGRSHKLVHIPTSCVGVWRRAFRPGGMPHLGYVRASTLCGKRIHFARRWSPSESTPVRGRGRPTHPSEVYCGLCRQASATRAESLIAQISARFEPVQDRAAVAA